MVTSFSYSKIQLYHDIKENFSNNSKGWLEIGYQFSFSGFRNHLSSSSASWQIFGAGVCAGSYSPLVRPKQ
jgi:hypothetical protein